MSRASGGTGTTWRLQVSFRPGPPEGATSLVIEIAHPPAPTERYTIDLT